MSRYETREKSRSTLASDRRRNMAGKPSREIPVGNGLVGMPAVGPLEAEGVRAVRDDRLKRQGAIPRRAVEEVLHTKSVVVEEDGDLVRPRLGSIRTRLRFTGTGLSGGHFSGIPKEATAASVSRETQTGDRSHRDRPRATQQQPAKATDCVRCKSRADEMVVSIS